jgi:predicted transcriptional regulator
MPRVRKEVRKVQVTSIELPEELYRGVKHQAVEERTTFKKIVEKALEQYLKRKEGKNR